MNHLLPVILCGGSGTRLWPLSRQQYPKQMLNLSGANTMLQATALRVAANGLPEDWQLDKPLVVAHEDCRFLTAEQLQQVGLTGARILLEPSGRNTAPALTIAALSAMTEDADPVMIVMPADHVMTDVAGFQSALSHALPLAVQGRIVTFGIMPTSPETGYGYIRSGASLEDNGTDDAGISIIEAFVEKPDRETAEQYLSDGDFLWNSGIYLLRASVWLRQIERFRPDILLACEEAMISAKTDQDFLRVERAAFMACPSESIDYAVMEPLVMTDREHQLTAVQRLEAGWSDVGAWNALMDIGEKDDDGNVLSGDALAFSSHNTLVRAESRLVACIGMEDAVVVETADAVLVTRRDQLHLVKDAVAKMQSAGRSECETHRKVHRPWGYYDGVDAGHRFQVKRIVVSPGSRLSLQMHHHRAEHWIVVMGTAKVTRGDEQFLLSENQSTYIPLGIVHRLENPGILPLEIIEVQSGAYLGEDDIVRFADAYQRDAMPLAAEASQLNEVSKFTAKAVNSVPGF